MGVRAAELHILAEDSSLGLDVWSSDSGPTSGAPYVIPDGHAQSIGQTAACCLHKLAEEKRGTKENGSLHMS